MKSRKNIFLLILIFMACTQFYTRKFVPIDTIVRKLYGWDIDIKLFVYDNVAIGRELSEADSIYTMWLYFLCPKNEFHTNNEYSEIKFEIESAVIRVSDKQKSLNVRYVGQNTDYQDNVYRLFDLGTIGISSEIKQIHLEFTVIVKRKDDGNLINKEKFIIAMKKYESVKKSFWLPSR